MLHNLGTTQTHTTSCRLGLTHRLSPIRPTLTAAAWLVIMAVSKGGGGEGEEGRRERREERGNKEKGEERNDDEKVKGKEQEKIMVF